MTITTEAGMDLIRQAHLETQRMEKEQVENLLTDPFTEDSLHAAIDRGETTAMPFVADDSPEEQRLLAEIDQALDRLRASVDRVIERLSVAAFNSTEAVLDMARVMRSYDERWAARHPGYMGRDWYCYCSPSRGMFHDRDRESVMERMPMMQMPPNPWIPDSQELDQVRRDMQEAVATDMRVMTTTWLPAQEHVCLHDRNGRCVWASCPHPRPSTELAIREVIPEPKHSRLPQLSMIGVLAVTACVFALDIAAALFI